MAYDAPRPYRPQAHTLTSPDSYDSLRPPPSVTQWSAASGSGSGSGYSSPSGSSERFATHGPEMGGRGAPPPPHPGVLQKREKGPKHEALDIGGTGVQRPKQDSRLARKRVTLMVTSGLIVCAIIAVVVLGCKKML